MKITYLLVLLGMQYKSKIKLSEIISQFIVVFIKLNK